MIERHRRAGALDIALRPNHSASRRQLGWWLFGMAATTGAVATLMAAWGAWPVLPLAGAEIALLVILCRAVWRRGERCERIRLSQHDAEVRVSCASAPERRVRLQRNGASVDLLSDEGASGGIALSDRRRRIEVGTFLAPADAERLLTWLNEEGLPLHRCGPRRRLRL